MCEILEVEELFIVPVSWVWVLMLKSFLFRDFVKGDRYVISDWDCCDVEGSLVK